MQGGSPHSGLRGFKGIVAGSRVAREDVVDGAVHVPPHIAQHEHRIAGIVGDLVVRTPEHLRVAGGSVCVVSELGDIDVLMQLHAAPTPSSPLYAAFLYGRNALVSARALPSL